MSERNDLVRKLLGEDTEDAEGTGAEYDTPPEVAFEEKLESMLNRAGIDAKFVSSLPEIGQATSPSQGLVVVDSSGNRLLVVVSVFSLGQDEAGGEIG
jgi:hypothetical protein